MEARRDMPAILAPVEAATDRAESPAKKAAEAAFSRGSKRDQPAAGVFAEVLPAVLVPPRVYFCLNFSTRPAVSTIFWRPV